MANLGEEDSRHELVGPIESGEVNPLKTEEESKTPIGQDIGASKPKNDGPTPSTLGTKVKRVVVKRK